MQKTIANCFCKLYSLREYSLQKFIFIASLMLSSLTFAQSIEIRSSSKEIIPFAEIYCKNGGFVGFANESGVIPKNIFENLQKCSSDSIEVKHMGFKPQIVSLENLRKVSFIELQESSILLKEIKIIPQKNLAYTILRGYFRSYDLVENNLADYYDGLIEIAVPNNKKGNVKLKRIDERYMKIDPNLEKSSLSILYSAPHIPIFYFSNDNYFSQYQKSYTKNMIVVGYKNIEKTVSQDLSIISPDKPKTLGVGSMKNTFFDHHQFSVFNTKDINAASFKDLLYSKATKKFSAERKELKNSVTVVHFGELIILETTESDTLDDDFKRFSGRFEGAKPKTQFWKDIEKHPFYEPLDSKMTKLVEEYSKK